MKFLNYPGRKAAPLLAALALGVRLIASCASSDGGAKGAAGGGGQAGSSVTGGSAGYQGTAGCPGKLPAPICKAGDGPATLTYYTADGCSSQPVAHTVDCPSGCLFLSPTVARCHPGPGVAPIQNCSSDQDCQGASYCLNAQQLRQLGEPVCTDGLCDWKTRNDESCPVQCNPAQDACTQGSGGTTSGGFPWGQGGGGQGSGGQGGGQGGGGQGGSAAGNQAGCGGLGSGKLPPPSCPINQAPATLTYDTLDACQQPVSHSVNCPQGCIFTSPTSVQCRPALGAVPFQTCASAADCQGSHYCVDSKHERLLDAPTCDEGVCDWQAQTEETCSGNCETFDGYCDGWQGGQEQGTTSGGLPVAIGTCDGATITYKYEEGAAGGMIYTEAHTCQKSCYENADGAGCDQVTGEAPFHTCYQGQGCPKVATQCLADDPGSITEWVQPTCQLLGLCGWAGTIKKACPAGTTCVGSSCVAPGSGAGGAGGNGGSSQGGAGGS